MPWESTTLRTAIGSYLWHRSVGSLRLYEGIECGSLVCHRSRRYTSRTRVIVWVMALAGRLTNYAKIQLCSDFMLTNCSEERDLVVGPNKRVTLRGLLVLCVSSVYSLRYWCKGRTFKPQLNDPTLTETTDKHPHLPAVVGISCSRRLERAG